MNNPQKVIELRDNSLHLTKKEGESFQSRKTFSYLNDLGNHDKRFYKKILTSNLGLLSFYKGNGSLRHMRCTRDPLLIPKSRYPELLQKDQISISRMVPVYDLDKNEFRSFKTERLEFFTLIHDSDASLTVRDLFLRHHAKKTMAAIGGSEKQLKAALDCCSYSMRNYCLDAYRIKDANYDEIDKCIKEHGLDSLQVFKLSEYKEWVLIKLIDSISESDHVPDDFFNHKATPKGVRYGDLLLNIASSMLDEYIKNRSTCTVFNQFCYEENDDYFRY